MVHIHLPSTSPAADKCPLHLLKGLESDPAPTDMHKPSKTSNKIDKAQCFPVLPKGLDSKQLRQNLHSKNYKTFLQK